MAITLPLFFFCSNWLALKQRTLLIELEPECRLDWVLMTLDPNHNQVGRLGAENSLDLPFVR
jgi:hypothetical protein